MKHGLRGHQRSYNKIVIELTQNMIEQKGITFDHDFSYSFLLFSSLLKKGEEEKENE